MLDSFIPIPAGMLKIKPFLSLLLLLFQLAVYSQHSDDPANTTITRFEYKGYKTLQEYIRRNADFSDMAARNTGVLLAAT
jgi:hypothetical protein